MPLPHQSRPDDPELQWLENLIGDLFSTLWKIATAIVGILAWALMAAFKK